MSDLIDRQAAIYALDGEVVVTGKTNAKAVKEYIQKVSDRLKAIPSAEVEPVKRGKWLYNGSDGYNMLGEEFRWKKCSLCGYSYSTTLNKSHNYCPNCGAKMGNPE